MTLLNSESNANENSPSSSPEKEKAETPPSPKKKKVIYALLAGLAIFGACQWMGGGDPEPEPQEPSKPEATVEPGLDVGETDTYTDSYIEDLQQKTKDATDKVFDELDNAGLRETSGGLPLWVGADAPSSDAVPSTGRIEVAGGAVGVDKTPMPDAVAAPEPGEEREGAQQAEDTEPSQPESEPDIVDKGIDKAAEEAKKLAPGGAVGGFAVDQGAGMLRGVLGGR